MLARPLKVGNQQFIGARKTGLFRQAEFDLPRNSRAQVVF
jgi:hypothetical protein